MRLLFLLYEKMPKTEKLELRAKNEKCQGPDSRITLRTYHPTRDGNDKRRTMYVYQS